MSFRAIFSNCTAVAWNGQTITGVQEITLSEEASRVAAGADDELHESVQFMGMRTTQVTMVLQTPAPFTLPITNVGTSAMGTLTWTARGRMGTNDRIYSIANVQWFSMPTNGAFGDMRKWNLTGHAVVSNSSDPTPVTVVYS